MKKSIAMRPIRIYVAGSKTEEAIKAIESEKDRLGLFIEVYTPSMSGAQNDEEQYDSENLMLRRADHILFWLDDRDEDYCKHLVQIGESFIRDPYHLHIGITPEMKGRKELDYLSMRRSSLISDNLSDIAKKMFQYHKSNKE